MPVRNDDNAKTLAARVLDAEHRTLVAAVGWYCAGRLVIDDARVRVKNEHADLPPQIVPAPDLS